MQIEESVFVEGGETRDLFIAGNGNDFIVGGDGVDTLIGGDGDDFIVGDTYTRGQHFRFETEPLEPGAEGDIGSAELLIGGAGNDVIIGAGWDDSIIDDGLFSEEEITSPDVVRAISLFPSPLRNVLWGGTGDDSLYAGAGGDTLGAGDGDDLVVGGFAADMIFGGSGNDTILAGDGDDQIWGGEGDDVLSSGEGADMFFFAEGHGDDWVEDFDPELDTLVLTNTLHGFTARIGLEGPFVEGAFPLIVFETELDGVPILTLHTAPDDSIFLVGLTRDDFSNLNIIT